MRAQDEQMYKLVGRYSALGIEMTLCVAATTWGGNWLDERWHTSPWLLLLGFVVGGGAAGVSLKRALRL